MTMVGRGVEWGGRPWHSADEQRRTAPPALVGLPVDATTVRRARVEVSFSIDLEQYAKFYGDDVSDETEQDALNELGAWLRHSFQSEEGRMRSPWYRAVVSRPTPVNGESQPD